jgi:hypothetical protein
MAKDFDKRGVSASKTLTSKNARVRHFSRFSRSGCRTAPENQGPTLQSFATTNRLYVGYHGGTEVT